MQSPLRLSPASPRLDLVASTLHERLIQPASPLPALLLLALLAGCGEGGGIVLPGEGEPAAIAVVEGNGQLGRVGEPLNDPLVVQVTDSRGRPVEGATVAFEFGSAGTGAAVVPPETATDQDGLADARLVLGTSVGEHTGQARIVLGAGHGPIQAPFRATALPENANNMTAVSGLDQTGHVGLPLDDRLVVEVVDGFGNPVAGVPISWAAVGGGSVSDAVVETDEDGRARVDRILGPAVGPQSTVATSEGLAGSPVTFVHTALPGDAARLIVISGNDQTAEAGALLPDELVVQLIDPNGNGIPQTAVSWVVATGGGAPAPENTTTDASGRTSARWTLGALLGQQRLDAVVSGVGVASFRATAVAVAPPSLLIRTQPASSARNGIPLSRQPVIQLRDSRGGDVAQAGVQVSVTIGSGGGELGGTRQASTDASGQAAFTNLSIAGAPGPRTLIFTAPGYAQATSSEIELAAVATTTTITADSPDPSGAGAAFQVQVRVSSDGPTPTGVVTVGVNGESATCTATLSGGVGSCPLALDGAGNRTLTAAYSGAPGFSASSDTEPHTVTAAPPPPPAGTTTTITADSPDPSVSGSTFTVSFEVTSQAGTPTGSVTVSVSGGGTTCSGNLSGGSGSCQLTLNTVGDRTLTATYSGAPGFAGSSDTEPHRVEPSQPPPPAITATEITADSPDPSVSGSTFTVSFRVTSGGGTPTGSVTVSVSGSSSACTGTLSGGSGSCQLTLNTAGDRTLTASYSGAAGFSSSSDTEPHRVEPAPPSNKAPKADFNWHCEGLTCNFTDASKDDDGSIASRSWSFGDGGTSSEQNPAHRYPAAGKYTVSLTVTDDDGASDVSSADVKVDAEELQIRTQPSSSARAGEAFSQQPEVELRAGGEDIRRSGVVITASIESGAGTLGGTTTATTDSEGRAKFTNLSIGSATGPHTLRFSASGFTPTISKTVNVQKAGSFTSITSDQPDPSVAGSTFTVQFTVRAAEGGDTPTGTVTVSVSGGTPSCTGQLSGGAGRCDLTLNIVGNRTLTATYSGDNFFSGSVDQEAHTVDPQPVPNRPPTAGDDAATTDPGVGVTINVLANDTDPEGNALSILSVSDPPNGSAVISGSTITYTPDPGFGGAADQFSYVVTDGSLSDEGLVTVTVSSPQSPPPSDDD